MENNNMGKTKVGSSSQIIPFKYAPSFFRIYLPELYSHKMAIPKDFIQYFNGTIPEKATLKNLQGEAWTVELEVVGKRVYIAKGWEEYKTSHSLVRGDFLVFEPLDCYDFFVKVFGPHGSIKEESLPMNVGNDQFSVTNERRPADRAGKACRSSGRYDATAGNLQFSKIFRETSKCFMQVAGGVAVTSKAFNKCVKSSLLRNQWFSIVHCMTGSSIMVRIGSIIDLRKTKWLTIDVECSQSVPKSVLDECVNKPTQSINLWNEKGYAKKIRLRNATNRVVMASKGITKFWRESKVREGDQLDFEVILGEGGTIKEFRFKVSSRSKKSS